MKKLLGIVVMGILLSGNAFAETVNQRLEKIEERLKKIEESLEGLEILSEIMKNPEATLLDVFEDKSSVKEDIGNIKNT